MSHNIQKSIDGFYTALGQPTMQFQRFVEGEFLPKLKAPMLRGGPSKQKRKEAIKEAVDAMQMYGSINTMDAAEKRMKFETAFRNVFKGEMLPPNTPGGGVAVAKMKLLEAKYGILEEKFRLLDYWQAVATGTTEPEYPPGGAHWSTHELLQHDPTKVRPILELLLDDAKAVLNSNHFSAGMEMWRGAQATVKKEFTKDHISRTLNFEATAKAGAEIKGEIEMVYEGLKVNANAELFAGARGSAHANLNLTPTEISMGMGFECELAVHFKANATIDVLDVLEVEVELDALAGALASGEASFKLTPTGVKAKVGAEAFAGVRVSGSAKGTLKIGGREITSAKVKGDLQAGVGASGEASFECDIFGKMSFGAKGGLTVGVGGNVDGLITVDFHNIAWGSANLFWVAVNELGYKKKGKVWFLPVEENVQMALKARDALFLIMGDLYRQNEAEVAILERWSRIKRRVSARA